MLLEECGREWQREGVQVRAALYYKYVGSSLSGPADNSQYLCEQQTSAVALDTVLVVDFLNSQRRKRDINLPNLRKSRPIFLQRVRKPPVLGPIDQPFHSLRSSPPQHNAADRCLTLLPPSPCTSGFFRYA